MSCNMKISKYQKLLTTQCTIIADNVSEDMKNNSFYVGSTEKNPVAHNAILYRWWFPKDSEPMKVLEKYIEDHPKDLIMQDLLSNLEQRMEDGKTYYALYFGKSNNGYNRYRQHTAGNVDDSTLRLTLYGLCIGETYDNAKEQQINEMLCQCYYEWVDFGNEENIVECIEGICIALGKYPLNIDGNVAVSKEWLDYLTNKRRLSNLKKSTRK